jgi:TonB family protein
MIRGVVRVLTVAVCVLVVFACAAPPAPVSPPAAPPPPPPEPVQQRVIGVARVTASALNVRVEPATDADVIGQLKKGTSVDVLADDDSWTKVRLATGEVGWVASRFLSSGDAAKKSAAKTPRRKGCPGDSDYAFVETPALAFSDSGAHGLVVVEANVNASGKVTGTKVVSNSTGDDALGFLAQREIRSAKFSPPIRDCATRSFIFTYRRTF